MVIFYKGRAQDYSFLSNMYRNLETGTLDSPITFHNKQNMPFITSEHLYKYLKGRFFGDQSIDAIFAVCDPWALKPYAKYQTTLSNCGDQRRWEYVRMQVMVIVSYLKFTTDSRLRSLLIATNMHELIEDTPHRIWGRGWDGNGQNLHGRSLMQVRHWLTNPVSCPSTVVIGDSLIAGVRMNDVQLISLRGARSGQIYLIADLVAHLPFVQTIIVHCGTNDLSPRFCDRGLAGGAQSMPNGASPLRLAKDMERRAQGIVGRHKDKVFIFTTPVSRPCDQHLSLKKRTGFTKYCSTYIQLLSLLKVRHRNVHCLDLSEEGMFIPAVHFKHDMLHLNSSGQSLLAKIFRDKLASIHS